MANKKANKKPTASKKQQAEESSFFSQKNSFALIFIAVVTFLCYLPVLSNSFVNWDESLYISDNMLIRSFNLKDIFSTYHLGNYHPITMLVYTIEYQFFGLHETGYHAVNVLLHLSNTILVFYLVSLISGKREIAIVASLLFGIHPLHVESVAWAAELKDLLYTMFFLASYICYIKFTRNDLRKFYTYSLILFLLSLLSKAMAASLPVLLVLTDYFLGRKINGKTLLEKVPFIALSIILGAVAVFAQRESGATDIVVFPLAYRIVFASYGFITYIFKLIIPFDLGAYYPYPIKEGGSLPAIFYMYVFLLITLFAIAVYSLRYSRKIFFGFGFFAITVFLVLQLFPVGGAIMADRYSYIPSIAIFYLVAEGFYMLWEKNKFGQGFKFPVIILLGLMTIFYSVKTYSRCMVWNNPMTLWSSVLEKYPDIPMAYSNRGLYLAGESKFDEALSDYNKAVELVPNMSKIYLNRALVLVYLNKYDEALVDYNKAIELDPEYAEAFNNRGILYKDQRKFDLALLDYKKAIELKPELSSAYSNRGFIYMYQNKMNEALADFDKAIELNPDNGEAYDNQGTVFVYQKRYDEALDNFNRSIKLLPNYSQPYFDRGNLFMNQKKNEDAYSDFSMAIELDSTFTDAYVNRASILQRMNRAEEALADCNTALAIEPGFSQAYYNRGLIYLQQKNFTAAIADLTNSINLEPQYAMSYYNRGIAEYYIGNKTSACADIQQAAKMGVESAGPMFDKFCR